MRGCVLNPLPLAPPFVHGQMLVLDEADLLLSFGYEDDVKVGLGSWQPAWYTRGGTWCLLREGQGGGGACDG